MNKKMISTFILGALLVTGCGGGGGGGSSGGSSPGLTTSTTPTAQFATSSQTSANSLTKEIQGGTPDLVAAVSMQNIPAAISTLTGGFSSLPAGVASTISCTSLSGGISGTVTVDTNSSGTITAGTYVNMTYSSCVFAVSTTTFTLNGSSKITYTRFNSYSDYATSVSYSNFYMNIVDSATATNDTYGPVNGSYILDNSNGTITIATQLPNGGVTNLVTANVVYSGNTVTITSATYVYNSPSASGIIKVVFNNWVYDSTTGYPVSGTITVTDANGSTVVIDDTSGTVVVTYNINGTATPYTVTFP